METKKDRTIYNCLQCVNGLSVIELLIGIFLSSLALLIIIDILISQDKVFYTQSDIAESQHNLRIAMKRLSRDIMMAGAGRPYWSTINGNEGLNFSIRFSNGNLDVVGAIDPPIARIAADVSAGSTSITLQSGEASRFNTTTRCDIRIGDGENAKIVGISGDTLTLDTDPFISGNQPLSYNYKAGTEVYLVKWITYYLDQSNPDKPVLKINEHDGNPPKTIAEYITSFHVAITGNIAEVTLTGRTRKKSWTTGEYITTEISDKILMRNSL